MMDGSQKDDLPMETAEPVSAEIIRLVGGMSFLEKQILKLIVQRVADIEAEKGEEAAVNALTYASSQLFTKTH